MLTGSHFISGERPAQNPGRFQAIDPRAAAPLEPGFAEASASEVDAAVAAAADAARSWPRQPAEKRAALLERAAEEIEALGDALTERADRETALGVDRLTGERGRTCGQLRFFAELLRQNCWRPLRIDRGDPGRAPIPKPDLRRTLVPLGPVAVFGASNFPLAFSVAGGDTASAWAAGCPVVVKGHPAHPGTSELVAAALVKAIEATGAPTGAFSLLQGADHELGRHLVEQPKLAAVAFTGSFAGGRALTTIAQARTRPIPVFAEMGSINPLLILEGALDRSPDDIARGLAASVTLGCGQFCTNPGLTLLPAGQAGERFAESLVAQFSVDDDMVAVHRGIAAGYRDALARAAGTAGIELILGSPAEDESGQMRPAVLRTTAETFLVNARLREEIYGPATLLVTWRDEAELEKLLNALPGSLTASIHARQSELAERPWILERLMECAGRVIVNGFPTGVEVAHAMHHGGPFPACSDPRSTSVGSAAIERFMRPVCLQDVPDALLPPELQDANPLSIPRLVDGAWTREPIVAAEGNGR